MIKNTLKNNHHYNVKRIQYILYCVALNYSLILNKLF